jgi:comEA protein
MTTIQNLSRLSIVRATLAALAFAATLASLGPANVSAQQRRPAVAQAPQSSAPGVVNIQTATSEQLQLLPGIGPSKAQAIVSFRERHAFRRVEDILRVRGIGRATFRRLRPMLTVQGQTTMTERARATPASSEGASEEQE